ncbi:type II secretion system F family protein [Bacillus sp. B-jedd]|uniref:type II secretion system F family protein n=1 Tax=Bacillus sp. B-jedd TaxID=1476857 RepID=UPI0005155679|nr:type II secretion system F family protein [Bacillus sp. B-jedd]CEG26055.1 Bacterial type II secretion system protein F domain protein [Bacillus sp. B-jedd]
MLYLTFFLTITLLIYSLMTGKTNKKSAMEKRVAVYITGGQEKPAPGKEKEEQPSFYQRFFKPILNDFKKSFKKRMPGEKEAKLEIKLQRAGNPFGMGPVEFRLFQSAAAIIIPVIFAGYAALLRLGSSFIFFAVFAGLAFGAIMPNFYLKQKTKAREKMALKELPDTLDLLTVSLEAGLGFDAAVNKLVSKKEGVLADEFQRALEEMRLGKIRREALGGVRDRLEGVDAVKNFISSILQAEKLGIGMVQVLRAQSVEVREQRKQRAEEAAMKAPIKMLFPLVLFIFPSLFIVLLGPVVIQFMKGF